MRIVNVGFYTQLCEKHINYVNFVTIVCTRILCRLKTPTGFIPRGGKWWRLHSCSAHKFSRILFSKWIIEWAKPPKSRPPTPKRIVFLAKLRYNPLRSLSLKSSKLMSGDKPLSNWKAKQNSNGFADRKFRNNSWVLPYASMRPRLKAVI